MSDSLFTKLRQLRTSQGAEALLNDLIEQLRQQKQFHKLFDARMLKRKYELGLPLSRPSSLSDVPSDKRKELEETYIAAAREAGEGLLAADDIPGAWMYLQVIREPAPVAAAIDKIALATESSPRLEEVMHMALYQGVNPAKGVKLMLRNHGTCSTITAVDQSLTNLTPAQRQACSAVMVRHLYDELSANVRRSVEQKMPLINPDATLRELIAGREWLFEGGNYHVDVSHLNSVVRFARSLEAPAEELELALQLAEYGSKLDPALQYAGEPPFEDNYPAHIQFFRALLNRRPEEALQYFKDKLEAEPDEQDRPMLAYVLTDLLTRMNRLPEAVEVASKYLTNLGEEVDFSFAELCREAGKLDVLQTITEQKKDLVAFAAALLEQK